MIRGCQGTIKAKFITHLKVTDPDSNDQIELEVWKDPTSDGIFAIDSSFVDETNATIQSPFNPSYTLSLPEESIEEYIKNKDKTNERNKTS